MHIKALLVLLPLLLDPASSLAIPPAGDPRAAPGLDSSVHQSGVIPDYFENAPIHPGQRNRIEKHVKPIKSEKIKEDFDLGSQYHTLNARNPAKDKKNKNNGPKKDPKNTPKPAEEKSTTQETKPQGESSGTQPEGATTRSRQKEEDRKKEEERQKAEASKAAEESKKAEGQPPTEETKPQGEPSGTQPQSQPGSSEQKEEEKKSNPGGQTLNLPDRTKEDDKSSETKTDTPGTQGEPAKTPDQQGDQKDGADDKGKGKAPDKDGKKDYKDNMYHLVDPDPNKSRAKEALNGDRYFDRKIGDGNPNGPSRYNTHNPDFSGVQSPGQEPGVSKAESERTGEPQRPRPGEREEKATTGHKTKNEKGESNDPDPNQICILEADLGLFPFSAVRMAQDHPKATGSTGEGPEALDRRRPPPESVRPETKDFSTSNP